MKKLCKSSLCLVFIALACCIFLLASCGEETNTDTNEIPEPTQYTVHFYNETGAFLLASTTVNEGEPAIYPHSVPLKAPTADTGYIFAGWCSDKDGLQPIDLTSVTEDLTVYASFTTTTETHEVIFKDYNGVILSVQSVFHMNPAVEPETPNRIFHAFTGWSEDFSSITSDMVLFAQYIRQYRVTFIGRNGSVLKEETVNQGDDASAPDNIFVDGYTFLGWDCEFTNVQSHLSVKALYKANNYTATFQMPNGKIIDIVENIPFGASAPQPDVAPVYFDWSSMKGYRFSGWDKSFAAISNDITITALYEIEITEPIIIIESCEVKRGETEIPVYMYFCGTTNAYGLNISVSYDEDLALEKGDVKILSSNINVTNQTTTNLDTTNNVYNFCWSSGSSISINDRLSLFVFSFEIDKYANPGDYEIIIDDSSYFIDGNLNKITPIIISGNITIVN